MFRNLKAEMIRQNVTAEQIAQVIGKKVDTARRKINGKITIRHPECAKIAKLFAENNSIDYLFKTE